MTDNTVVIHFSVWKVIRMFLLCGLGLAAGYWIVRASFDPLISARPPMIVVISGYVMLITSFLALVLLIVPLVRAGPALVLDERGFNDHSGAASLGFVPWTDIASIRLWADGGQRALCLRLKDPDKYVPVVGPIKRAMLRLNRKIGPGEIALGSILLAIRFEQLEALVTNHVSAAQMAEPLKRSERA
jgi:hypothetical protein